MKPLFDVEMVIVFIVLYFVFNYMDVRLKKKFNYAKWLSYSKFVFVIVIGSAIGLSIYPQSNSAYIAQITPYLNRMNQDNQTYTQSLQEAQQGSMSMSQFFQTLHTVSSDINNVNSNLSQIQVPQNMQSAQQTLETCVTDFQDAIVDYEASIQTDNPSYVAQGNDAYQKSSNEYAKFKQQVGMN